tara:strand:- start:1491 stop:1778 length:288 start_codon:yes stop_codon:yes gene_type:complete
MKKNKMTKDLLDKDTCDRVMQDMEICLDDWSRQDLDTKAAVITLTRFAILTAFKFSHDPEDAVKLISSIVYDNFVKDPSNIEEFLSELEKGKTIH